MLILYKYGRKGIEKYANRGFLLLIFYNLSANFLKTTF